MSTPTGTVTFLFTDIEGSTKLWDQHPEAMREALERHDRLMHQSITANDGVVFKTMGDAFCVAFHTAPQALRAALTAQQRLQSETWPQDAYLGVRMALHTGTADERDGDYYGPPLNRIARLLSTGYGGQVLLSLPTYELIRDALPAQCTLQDLGAHSLRDLARPEQVYQLCHPDLLSDFSPLKSLDNPALPNNLPLQLTSFIGRERELEKIKELLDKTRLLTLTGSGGCGKTRLSLQAAADVLDTFPDGVWLVELAPITDPDLVPKAVADVLGIEEQPGKTLIQVLTESLKSKTMLLVLDNCEHLLDACAHVSDSLLRACPNVKVLASSREALNVAGEQTYRVPSLSLPDPKAIQTPQRLSQYEAVRLFIDRAVLVKPEFAVTNANAPALVSVCHRVDGIPLAIELAAARLRSLSVEEVNTRLDNRFRLLTGGSRTALPRQQTLRALIDWSYDLLTDQEKLLLIRLSVFSGGWSLAASESVCVSEEIEDWEVMDLLASLADKSLVQADTAEGQTRYRFLETVRQYARDRLAESEESFAVRARHRDYYLTMAEEIRPQVTGSEQAHWLSVLETEHDNLRQALTFCLEEADGGQKGLRLGGSLQAFWQIRGHVSEGRERLTALLSRSDAQDRTKGRADALNGAGSLARMQSEYGQARSLYEESLEIKRELGDRQGIAGSLNNLGLLALSQGDTRSAEMLYQEALSINRELGNRAGEAINLNNLGEVASDQADYAAARSWYEESLGIERELGNQNGIAASLINLGIVASEQGDYAVARSWYEESLAINRELGDRRGIAIALGTLGTVACSLGDYALARSFLEESLTIHRELGDRRGVAHFLGNLGAVTIEQGDYDSARSFLEESLKIKRELDNRRGIAASVKNLGDIAFCQGDYTLARGLYEESLLIQKDLGEWWIMAETLEAFAVLAVEEDRADQAPRLFGAAEALRESIGTPLSPGDRTYYDQVVTTAQALLSEDAFTAAWAEGRAMTWEQAVEEALS